MIDVRMHRTVDLGMASVSPTLGPDMRPDDDVLSLVVNRHRTVHCVRDRAKGGPPERTVPWHRLTQCGISLDEPSLEWRRFEGRGADITCISCAWWGEYIPQERWLARAAAREEAEDAVLDAERQDRKRGGSRR